MAKKSLPLFLAVLFFIPFSYANAEDIKPDFIVSAINVTPENPKVGENVVIEVVYNNVGGIFAGADFNGLINFGQRDGKFKFKNDNAIPTTNRAYPSASSPWETGSLFKEVYEGQFLSAAQMLLIVEPDSLRKIAEINDENNLLTKTITVGSAPLTVTITEMYNMTETGVAIGWQTSEPTTGQVDYNLDGNFGAFQIAQDQSNEKRTSYLVQLNDLKPNTKYYFRIDSWTSLPDRPGVPDKRVISPVQTFTTKAPVVDPASIDSRIIQTGSTSVTFRVTGSSPFTRGGMFYDTTSLTQKNNGFLGLLAQGTLESSNTFVVTLPGLTPQTEYTYKPFVVINDRTGYGNVSTFTTLSNATTEQPTITNVHVTDITGTSATITWDTDLASNSGVTYFYPENGKQKNQWWNWDARNNYTQTHHVVVLTDLLPSTTYYYEVGSQFRDSTRVAWSETKSFATPIIGATQHVVVTNLRVADVTRTSATITWNTNVPAETNLQYGKTPPKTDSTVLGSAETEANDSVPKTSHRVQLDNLTPNIPYYYRVTYFELGKATRTAGDTRTFITGGAVVTTPAVLPADRIETQPIVTPRPEKIIPSATQATPDRQITVITENAKRLNNEQFDTILSELRELRNVVKEQQTELKYLRSLKEDVASLGQKVESAITNFVTYGVDENTKKLGEGERAAVLHSYKQAFDKLPETDADFADAIKIASGRFPSQKSADAEAKAKAHFKKIYKRDPINDNPNDIAAVTVMAYGLRQKAENRNLNSERTGIITFSRIYGKAPTTTEEWNVMQAITYSGATRKPRDVDSDGDGLSDKREKELGTDSNDADTDGDGYKDGEEVANGYNPLDSAPTE